MLQFEQKVSIIATLWTFGISIIFSFLMAFLRYPNIWKPFLFHFFVFVLAILPMFFFRLKIKITAGEIHFRMVPFHWKEKVIKAENIAKLDLQTGNFYRKFLGFGIKYNGEGWAYFLANEKMLHITLHNGEQIWLGLPSQADLSSIQQTLDFNHE